ncbi:hypothetical protein P8452_63739 [Trifolium repens]|nr:hypothetical protein P8452_63739 [Trifolium repens]
MASNNIKIHEHFKVVPPSSIQTTSIPLSFFDTFWLRFHPVERIFFYTLPNSQSHPSFFFEKLIPKLKSSLSLTLKYFLPLAGNIVWHAESPNPIIQYTPNDGVSLLIAESNSNFNHVIENSPHEASLSRSFIPHLESTDSFASIISLQITIFPNSGFSIGISTNHAVLDGKSITMFIKAWAYLCNKTNETNESPTLLPELEPLFNREIIKDPNGLSVLLKDKLIEIMYKMFPNEKRNNRSLKMFPFEPKLKDYVRATFELTCEDLDKIKQRVLSTWELFDLGESRPKTLSSFVLACAYSSLEPPIPNNYFGNCVLVLGYLVDTQSLDFIKEDGVILVTKSIHDKIKMLNDKGLIEGLKDSASKYSSLSSEKVEYIGLVGSNRFGVYETDFGWGKPAKVEIVSIDRGLTIGLAESKDGSGGVEVGLILNKNVMNLFSTLFREGLCINSDGIINQLPYIY